MIAPTSPEAALAGHDHIAQTLGMCGITHVFGVPGVPVYETFGACARAGLRLIGTRGQQGAALMASAQNYWAGRQVAVSVASAGVAAANALTGAVVARDNGWPLVLLVGVPGTADGAQPFMGLDVATLYRPIVKGVAVLDGAANVAPMLEAALMLAMRGRPGPVLAVAPAHVLNGSAPWRRPPRSAPRPAGPSPGDECSDVADVLLRSRRPLLIVGDGVRWGSPFETLLALIDRLSLPFITAPIARGYLPDLHPLCCNAISGAVQREADAVIVAGSTLDWTFRHGVQIAPTAKLVFLGLDDAEIGGGEARRIAMPAVPTALARLWDATRARSASRDPSIPDRAWLDSLCRRREAAALAADMEVGRVESPIALERLAHELQAALPADAITVLDGNATMAACQRFLIAERPVSRLTPGTSGCMGTGIPFAIAAKLHFPERPVIAVVGDFAFGLSALELETATRHRTPVVVVVANNDGNGGNLRQHAILPGEGVDRVAAFLPGIRYERIAAALGCHAEHVASASAIGPALRRALNSQRPACLNVIVDPSAPFPRA
ncbi:MAG: thiamine pyrophosphate-dependent enzyme [Casimicrobiaceae bacterium]